MIDKVYGLQHTCMTLNARFTIWAAKAAAAATFSAMEFQPEHTCMTLNARFTIWAAKAAAAATFSAMEFQPESLPRWPEPQEATPYLQRADSMSTFIGNRVQRPTLATRRGAGGLRGRSSSRGTRGRGSFRGVGRAGQTRPRTAAMERNQMGQERRGQRRQVARRSRPFRRGAGRLAQRPTVTPEELDAQLEEYMACSRAALDRQLDEYMAEGVFSLEL